MYLLVIMLKTLNAQALTSSGNLPKSYGDVDTFYLRYLVLSVVMSTSMGPAAAKKAKNGEMGIFLVSFADKCKTKQSKGKF